MKVYALINSYMGLDPIDSVEEIYANKADAKKEAEKQNKLEVNPDSSLWRVWEYELKGGDK